MNLTQSSVLVIEDEPRLLESLVVYLEDMGYRVYQAKDGQQGLDACDAFLPDMIVTDLVMPVMNGLSFIQALKNKGLETPVIMLSGAGNIIDAIEALRLGAWDYLLKPLRDLTVLGHALSKAMERRHLLEENKRVRWQLEEHNKILQKSLAELKEDQKAGRRVQEKLLPPSTFTRGDYQLEYRINPSLYLSGDFVDYFVIDEDKLGFYIADVSGHGAASAFVTVYLKNVVGKLLARFEHSKELTILEPAHFLKAVSDELFIAKLGKYLTMIYCVLDTKLNTLVYSVGGHYPNPILVEKGQAQFLPGRGFALGILERATFEQQLIQLPASFSLAMFSDGVLEILEGDSFDENEQKILSMLSKDAITVDQIQTILGIENEKLDILPDDVAIFLLKKN